MADLQAMTKWCVEARDLLKGRVSSGAAKDFEKLAKRVGDVLGRLKNALSLGQITKEAYEGFEKDFEDLANEAKAAKEAHDKGTDSKAVSKARMTAVAGTLNKLSRTAELALGEVDPGATPEVREAVLAAARHKPVYLDKRQRIQEGIDRLSKLPGTKDQVAKLKRMLQAAEAVEPDYKAAYDALKGRSKTVAEGMNNAMSFVQDQKSPELTKALETAKAAVTKYEEFARLADASGVAAERAKINTILKTLAEAPKTDQKQALATAIKDLNEGAKRLLSLCGSLKTAGDQARQLGRTLREAMDELKTTAPIAVVQPLLSKFTAADALLGSQQYAAAQKAMTDLRDVDKLLEVRATHAQHRKAWLEIDGTLDAGLQVIQKAQNKYGISHPDLASVAGRLSVLISVELRGTLVRARDHAGAVALAQSAKLAEDLKALTTAIGNLDGGKPAAADFSSDESKLRVEVAAEGTKLNQAIDELFKTAKELTDKKGDAGAAEQKGREARNKWMELTGPFSLTKQSVEDRRKLLPGLGVDAGKLEAEVRTVIADLKLTLSTPQKLQENIDAKDKAQAQAQLKSEWNKVAAAVAYLRGFGLADNDALLTHAPGLAKMQSDLDGLKSKVDTGVATAEELKTLLEQATERRSEIEEHFEQQRAAALKTRGELDTQLSKLRKKAGDERAAFFDKQAGALADIMAMVNSSVAPVAEQGRAALAEFKLEMTAFENAVGNKNAESFDAVDAELKALATELDQSDLSDYEPQRRGALFAEKRDILPQKLIGLSPKAALALVRELRSRVDKALVDARTLKTAHEKLKQDATTLRQTLDKSGLESTAPALYAAFKARIQAAKDCPKHQVQASIRELGSVSLLITSAGDPAKRVRMEAKAQTDQLQAERDEAAYKAERDVLEKNLHTKAKNLRDLLKSQRRDVNIPLYDQIEGRMDDAAKDAKAKNFAGARQKIRMGSAAARAFLDEPLNPAAAARSSLMGLGVLYQQVIAQYINNANTLKGKMDEALKADSTIAEQDKKKFLDSLTPLLALFDPTDIVEGVKLLAEEPKDVGDKAEADTRRKKKEEALAALRRAERLIEENELVDAVRNNPFHPVPSAGLSSAVRQLSTALMASA